MSSQQIRSIGLRKTIIQANLEAAWPCPGNQATMIARHKQVNLATATMNEAHIIIAAMSLGEAM